MDGAAARPEPADHEPVSAALAGSDTRPEQAGAIQRGWPAAENAGTDAVPGIAPMPPADQAPEAGDPAALPPPQAPQRNSPPPRGEPLAHPLPPAPARPEPEQPANPGETGPRAQEAAPVRPRTGLAFGGLNRRAGAADSAAPRPPVRADQPDGQDAEDGRVDRVVRVDTPRLSRLPDTVAAPLRRGPTAESLGAIRSRRRRSFENGNVDAAPGAGSLPTRVVPGSATWTQPTVSAKTANFYQQRGRQLFANYCRERAMGASELSEVSVVEWVNWLLSRKPSMKATTWRVYRQSASFYLSGMPGDEVESAIALLDADIIDRSRKALTGDRNPGQEDEDTLARRRAKRSSALKEKRFPKEDFDRVLLALRRSGSDYARILADWLRAGILTGLRPAEWQACEIEEVPDDRAVYGRRVWLYVINAKATNGRGTGLSRTLDLSAIPDESLVPVRNMVANGRRWREENNFAATQSYVSQLLYRVTAKLWTRRNYGYALYSCRHQAIANWKTFLSREEIAAMSGHGSTLTATERYGKRTAGWAPDQIPACPRPVQEELAMVRHRMQLFEERLSLDRQTGVRRGSTERFPLA